MSRFTIILPETLIHSPEVGNLYPMKPDRTRQPIYLGIVLSGYVLPERLERPTRTVMTASASLALGVLVGKFISANTNWVG